MGRTEKVELTVLCLLYQENKILLQNRKKEDWKGFVLPGGHVEPSESIVDAVIREMKEETGLTIFAPVLCGVKQFPILGDVEKEEGEQSDRDRNCDSGRNRDIGRYLVFLFKTDQFEGTLTSSEEGEVEWVEREKLSEYATVDDFYELLQVMEDDALTEFQYTVQGDDWIVHKK